jgi:hypothetical protein
VAEWHKIYKIPRTDHMSRWKEAENRLHQLVDILKWVAIRSIRFTMLNDTKGIDNVTINQHAKSPDTFSRRWI